MGSRDQTRLWWDRGIDERSGRELRPDVRQAAHKVWQWVCAKAQELLGDPNDAAEVLETSVKTVSRYLDAEGVSLHSTDQAGLVAVVCYRSLLRLATKRRLKLIAPVSDLAEVLRAPDWRDEVERRLLIEELARELDPKTRGLLRLRINGFDWKEIGRMVGRTPEAIRRQFWRDVRKAYLRLMVAGKRSGFEML